jgi:hypothetical protein
LVSGVVSDANNAALANIQVSGGGASTLTSLTGQYLLSLATGTVQVTANPSNQNHAYSSAFNTLTLTVGQLVNNPFTLSLAGSLVGFFQTGSSTPLPGRTAVALQGGNQVAQGASDNSGHFYLNNLATGTYTVQPSLDPAETVTPLSVVVTLSSTGTATSVSTFTVTNGLAQITGQVTVGTPSQQITTGVLLVASTATISGANPPSLNGATGPLCAPCYYTGSSDATGQYTVSVRSSTTTYQLYGWYTTFNGSTPSTTRQGPYALNVSTAGVIVSQNIAW